MHIIFWFQLACLLVVACVPDIADKLAWFLGCWAGLVSWLYDETPRVFKKFLTDMKLEWLARR